MNNSLQILVGLLLALTFNVTQQAISFNIFEKKVKNYPKNYHAALNMHHNNYELLMTPNKYKTLFSIKLYFSDNKIPVDVYLDTGSGVLWVPSKVCRNAAK